MAQSLPQPTYLSFFHCTTAANAVSKRRGSPFLLQRCAHRAHPQRSFNTNATIISIFAKHSYNSVAHKIIFHAQRIISAKRRYSCTINTERLHPQAIIRNINLLRQIMYNSLRIQAFFIRKSIPPFNQAAQNELWLRKNNILSFALKSARSQKMHM